MTAQATPLLRDEQHLCDLLGIAFSEEQLAAVTTPVDQPQAIIAGAGSGKTAVMAARVLWLVAHDGVDPDAILGLTFTAKAAAELRTRVRATLARLLVTDDQGEPTISTYHAFAGQLIAEHGLRLGIEPDLRVMADASRFQLAAKVVRGHRGPLEQVSTWLPTVVGQVLALDGQISEHLVSTDELREFDAEHIRQLQRLDRQLKAHRDMLDTAARRVELTTLVDEYRAAKADAGVMDFSDQMAWGARLAALPQVRADLRDRFTVVLLDEYQDTSVAQRDLLQGLFAGVGISAVGDPAQGIYGWRGAASGNLVAFLDQFPAADGGRGTQHSLAVTRRCAHAIIDVAAAVAEPYYSDPLVRAVVTPLKAAPANPPGEVSVALHATVADELADLVDRVESAGTRRGWSGIAVLVRAANENGNIVAALRSRGIPVEIVGLSGLLDQPEVQDVLALLELTDDLTANPAALRLLTGPRWRIGDRDLALLGARADRLTRAWRDEEQPPPEDPLSAELLRATQGVDPTEVVSLCEAMEGPGDAEYSAAARERIADLAGVLRRLRRHAHEPLTDLTRRAVTELDLDVELAIGGTGAGDNLALFLNAVADYAREDSYASLTGLLAYLQAEREHNNGMELSTPSEADSVKVLTIHRSKGLEFDEVFVPFVVGDVFPSRRGRPVWLSNAAELPIPLRGDAQFLPEAVDISTTKGIKEFETALKCESQLEEVRLAYVAFTRARHRLHVSGHRWGRSQVRPRALSTFLDTVRSWLVEHGEAPVCWATEPAADDTNPLIATTSVPWPPVLHGMQSRREFADEVRRFRNAPRQRPGDGAPRLARIRDELSLLLDEHERAENQVVEVPLPATLAATSALAMADDEQAFARQLARPMPRRPSSAARFGSRFHAWLEARYGQQSLWDPLDLPGRGDTGVTDDDELAALQAAFESGVYAERAPVAVEWPFALRLGGQQLIGRIDAVFDDGRDVEVVDWKTSRHADADPLQLALYRIAWAEAHDIDPARVVGTFYYVRTGRCETFHDLPSAAELGARLRLR